MKLFILIIILLLIICRNYSCTIFSSYHSEEVIITNPVDGTKLAGTFTYPKEQGKYPAVLLIPGSGKANRDEEIFGHRPFYILADHLSSNGIAVLRMDKRGCGKSGGAYQFGEISNFTEDTFAAYTFLRQQAQVDQDKIGVLGHSQGGLIAPILATRDSSISFMVLMAGPGIWGIEFFYLQIKRMAELSHFTENDNNRLITLYDEIWPILTSETISPSDKKQGKKLLSEIWQFIDPESRKLMNMTDSNIDYFFSLYRSPSIQKLFSYDPKTTLSKVKCPVLAITGEKDVQVSSKKNFTAIKEALDSAGNNRYKILELEGLNHLFQSCNTGNVAEYPKIKETISPIALQTISKWIQEL